MNLCSAVGDVFPFWDRSIRTASVAVVSVWNFARKPSEKPVLCFDPTVNFVVFTAWWLWWAGVTGPVTDQAKYSEFQD